MFFKIKKLGQITGRKLGFFDYKNIIIEMGVSDRIAALSQSRNSYNFVAGLHTDLYITLHEFIVSFFVHQVRICPRSLCL